MLDTFDLTIFNLSVISTFDSASCVFCDDKYTRFFNKEPSC